MKGLFSPLLAVEQVQSRARMAIALGLARRRAGHRFCVDATGGVSCSI